MSIPETHTVEAGKFLQAITHLLESLSGSHGARASQPITSLHQPGNEAGNEVPVESEPQISSCGLENKSSAVPKVLKPHTDSRTTKHLAPTKMLRVISFFALMTPASCLSTFSKGWLPEVPGFINEWAALIPLTVYLSSTRDNYLYVGEISLRGELFVGFFPRLFIPGTISKLLTEKEVFFDTANVAGDPVLVYDVHWGSIFKCYNNAVTAAIIASVLERPGRAVLTGDDVGKWILANSDDVMNLLQATDGTIQANNHESKKDFMTQIHESLNIKRTRGRKQLLNVIHLKREQSSSSRRKSWVRGSLGVIYRFWILIGELAATVLLVAGLFATESYGTGSLLIVAGVTRRVINWAQIKRPPLYLQNSETHDGCMLATTHENSTAWYLFIGDREIIDTLLNKPMIEVGHVPQYLVLWLQVFQIVQLAGMTYCASQKGWDGVFLLAVVVLAWLSDMYMDIKRLAGRWLEKEGFSASAVTCEFSGRSDMVGAVQLLSTQNITSWMDGILAPGVRRDIWLKKIGAVKDQDAEETARVFCELSPRDKLWITGASAQSYAGAMMIKERIKGWENKRLLTHMDAAAATQ